MKMEMPSARTSPGHSLFLLYFQNSNFEDGTCQRYGNKSRWSAEVGIVAILEFDRKGCQEREAIA